MLYNDIPTDARQDTEKRSITFEQTGTELTVEARFENFGKGPTSDHIKFIPLEADVPGPEIDQRQSLYSFHVRS